MHFLLLDAFKYSGCMLSDTPPCSFLFQNTYRHTVEDQAGTVSVAKALHESSPSGDHLSLLTITLCNFIPSFSILPTFPTYPLFVHLSFTVVSSYYETQTLILISSVVLYQHLTSLNR